jgi:chromosome segregation ATPase
VRGLRDRSKNDSNSFIEEIKKLQDRLEENRDHEQMRKLKIENENLKIKHSELLSEIEGLNSQINELRSERQQQIWDNNKVVEVERERFRAARNELESVKLKQAQFEKDRYTLENELVKKRAEVDQLLMQEDNLKNHSNKLESECKNLRISENELKTKLYQKEEEFQRRITSIELERKKENDRLKTDLDTMRDQFDQSSRMNTQHFNINDDQEVIRQEKSR